MLYRLMGWLTGDERWPVVRLVLRAAVSGVVATAAFTAQRPWAASNLGPFPDHRGWFDVLGAVVIVASLSAVVSAVRAVEHYLGLRRSRPAQRPVSPE